MPHTLTRFVAIVLLLVQAMASLGRGGSLCVPLDFCGDEFVAHSHSHGSASGHAIVAHRHASGERRLAAERVHHACSHDHGAEHGGHGHRHAPGDGPPSDEHPACCGDHLHFNLVDHDLPPRSGTASDLLMSTTDLPASSRLAASERQSAGLRECAIDAVWLRSDQRRTIDVISIVV
jgi:hypothetical protein